MHRVGRHVVALLAVAAGHYAGLVVGVAGLGLSGGAEVAPLLSPTVAGLLVGVALGLFDGRQRLGSRTMAGLVAGAVIGLACWLVEPGLAWCVGGIVVLSQALAWRSWTDTGT